MVLYQSFFHFPTLPKDLYQDLKFNTPDTEIILPLKAQLFHETSYYFSMVSPYPQLPKPETPEPSLTPYSPRSTIVLNELTSPADSMSLSLCAFSLSFPISPW
jgi:hypothetical protein